MPNIAKVLKDEISRLARREAKKALTAANKPALGLRRTTAELKRKVAQLEKELHSLQRMLEGPRKAQPPTVSESIDRARITAKGVRSLRRKLRLTGQGFAGLLGITAQVVYGWEKASGALRIRGTTRAAILAIRGIGAREARRRLAEMKSAKKHGRTAPPQRRSGSKPTF